MHGKHFTDSPTSVIHVLNLHSISGYVFQDIYYGFALIVIVTDISEPIRSSGSLKTSSRGPFHFELAVLPVQKPLICTLGKGHTGNRSLHAVAYLLVSPHYMRVCCLVIET